MLKTNKNNLTENKADIRTRLLIKLNLPFVFQSRLDKLRLFLFGKMNIWNNNKHRIIRRRLMYNWIAVRKAITQFVSYKWDRSTLWLRLWKAQLTDAGYQLRIQKLYRHENVMKSKIKTGQARGGPVTLRVPDK